MSHPKTFLDYMECEISKKCKQILIRKMPKLVKDIIQNILHKKSIIL